MITALSVNLLFLINIVRIIITKLRNQPTLTTQQLQVVRIIIKGKEMALVWHEKASQTALQTSTVNFTHPLLVQTHNMITVKEIAEQCCQL